MYKTITDEFIISTLSHYEHRTRELHEKMQKSYKSIREDTEDMLSEVSFPRMDNHEMEGIKKNDFMDITDIYERFQRLSKERVRDVSHFMRSIVEEQETMNRIMAAYEVLDKKEKIILKELYIDAPEQKKTDSIKNLEKKYSYSESSLFRWRKRAIEHIKQIYNSDLTQSEIYCLQFQGTPSDCLKKKTYR